MIARRPAPVKVFLEPALSPRGQEVVDLDGSVRLTPEVAAVELAKLN